MDTTCAAKRRYPPAKSKSEMLYEVWSKLNTLMGRLFDNEEQVDRDSYIELQILMYNFCSSGGAPSPKSGKLSGPHIAAGKGSYEHSLYLQIERYFHQRIKKLQHMLALIDESDENAVIEFYVKYAGIYFKATNQINGICRHLNNEWVKRVNNSKEPLRVHKIEHLAYMCWKKDIFDHVGQMVTGSILKLIEKVRAGQVIKPENINAVVASLLKLGYDPNRVLEIEERMRAPGIRALPPLEIEQEHNNLMLNMELSYYRNLFERKFLEDTTQWMDSVIDRRPQKETSVEYANMIFSLAGSERELVRKYLHISTEMNILRILVEHGITFKRTKFFDSLQEMFDSHRHKELNHGYQHEVISSFLQKMHDLCNINPDDHKVLLDKFKSQIQLEINERIRQGFESNQKDTDAHFYMDVFVNTYFAIKLILDASNINDKELKTMLQSGTSEAFASNAISEKRKSFAYYSENMFARKLHLLLSNKKLKSEDVEKALNDLMDLFLMLPNQTAFESNYRKNMAIRLVDKTSTSTELEVKVIEEIEKKTGLEYVRKVKKLFQEGTQISPELGAKFKSEHAKAMPYDFEATILPSKICPWSTDPEGFILHDQFVAAHSTFGTHYQKVNPNRRIIWLHSRTKGELKTNCFSKEYILNCSLYQMSVMLMYNDTESHTFAEVLSFTGLDQATAQNAVIALVKVDLLLLERKGSPLPYEGVKLENDDVIKLNRDFHSANTKIRVNANVRIEQDTQDQTQVISDTDIALGHKIDACIVRTMKGKKKVKHNDLTQEIINYLTETKNRVSIKLIKKSISSLIDREFITRDEKNSEIYHYIA